MALPIAAGERKVRRSRMGPLRAGVLILVHVLIAVHVAHWLYAERTISPLEPSEAMEFAKRGVVNAGFIFFALAIGSTLVLGRWFCGWACHLVAMQDLCRWLLARVRIRPKPIRSTVMMTVPLIAFIYMFVAPALYPLAMRLVGLEPGYEWQYASMSLTTASFWATFPSWLPATVTILICGYLIVYVLGAKGFCSVACPYGAAFGFVDRYAPLRIRVTDDCRGSGHCTAVCTSNVRVHEEVRQFRMVVDPGCMKCLDCVSVCPNHALYYGWGAPAAVAAAAPAPAKVSPAKHASWSRWALLIPFIYAAYLLFHGFDSPRRYAFAPADIAYAGILTAITSAVMWLARGKSPRARECTFVEEALLGVFFLVGVFAFRGLHDFVPFLLALGWGAVLAFLLCQSSLLLGRRQVGVLGFRLKRDGRLLAGGYGFVAVVAAITALSGYAFATQWADVALRHRTYTRVEQLDPLFADVTAMGDAADAAIPTYRDVLRIERGNPARADQLVRLLASRGRFGEAAQVYREQLELHPDHAPTLFGMAMLEAIQNHAPETIAWLEKTLAADPQFVPAHAALGQIYAGENRPRDAIRHLSRVVELVPVQGDDAAGARLTLSHCHAALGEWEVALSHADAAARAAPDRPEVLAEVQALRSAAAERGQP